MALLRQSAKDNGFDNIDVLAVALGERAGAAALETDGSNGRVIPIDGPPAQAVEASFVVATYPLDTVLNELGASRVDVIKIDVEGAEPLVMRGSTRTISESRPLLISEFYPLALDSSPWGNASRLPGHAPRASATGCRSSATRCARRRRDPVLGEPAEKGHVDLLARPA